MNVPQDLIYSASRIYFKLLMTIFRLMMSIESRVFLKNHVSCNFMLKYFITVSLRQFTKFLNQFFDLFRANKNLEICMLFDLCN